MSCSKSFVFLLAAGLVLAGCSKKEQTAANTSPASPAPATATVSNPAPEAPAAPALSAPLPTPSAEIVQQPPAQDEPTVRFNAPAGGSAQRTADAPTIRDPGAAALPATAGPVPGDGKDAVEPPQIVQYYPPFYPLPLRMEGVEGQVVLALGIDNDGTVAKVEVFRSNLPQLNASALEAAKLWKFSPARRNGQPVAVVVPFPIQFVSEFASMGVSAESPLANLTYIDGMYYSRSAQGRLTPANVSVTPLNRVNAFFDPAAIGDKEVVAVLRFVVNEQGQVVDPVVAQSSGTEFDAAALQAIRFWQFVPEIRAGKPQPQRVDLPFRLSGKARSG